MSCLVATTLTFLAIFISGTVVGVSFEKLDLRNVSEDLSLVVVDTDMGTDDAFAVMMLLEAERRYYDPIQNVGPRVLAVTCVNGNTYVDNVVVNVLKVLNVTGRLDGSIAVHRGASKTILKTPARNFHYGRDGLGDVPGVPTPSQDYVNSTHAAVALVDIVNRYPGTVTLLALGPLTNVAMAIRLDEDFLKKLKQLYILGGATEGRGNIAPGVEFNFYMDPEANYIVLRDSEYNRNTVTLLSWEQAKKLQITKEWRVKELGALTSDRMRFLNLAGGISPEKTEGFWVHADAVAAAVLLYPELAQRVDHHAVIPFTQGEARGAIVVDYYNKCSIEKCPRTVELVIDVQAQPYKELLLDYFAN